MAWSFGHSLTVILALLLGVAGGWVLRGRRDAQESGQATVDGGAAAPAAVLATPAPAAVTDPGPAAATIDPAPSEVADEPATDSLARPNDTVVPDDAALAATAGAATASDVDPADMALTDGPAPVVAPRSAPEAERLDAPGAGGSPEPAAVTAESEPVTGSAVAGEPVPATTPGTETGFTASFAAEPFGVLVPATTSEEDTRPHVESAPETATGADAASEASADVEPAVHTRAETTPAEKAAAPDAEPATTATPTEATPVEKAAAASADVEPAVHMRAEATPDEAAPADGPATDGPVAAGQAEDEARAEVPAAATRRSPVAAPPVRPVAATSVEVDDFRRIQGIGPKMAAALQSAGVRTYRQLADLDETALRELIRGAGLRAAPGLATWPQQARVLASAPDAAATALPARNGTSEG